MPSVSMSEISHIPISRCSTVSRLDRIRTLWRSMLPLGVWKRKRCVASSSAGRRAAPGPCPAWSVDEASVLCVAGRFMTQALRVRKEKKTGRISTMRNYITSPQVYMVDCSMTVCVRMILKILQFVFFSLFFAALVST